MQWGDEQKDALRAVDKWFYHDTKKKKWFFVGGYAGTGKTTLAKHFASNIDGDVCFGAFTGKAALVMRKAGCIGARTLHSLIYIAEVDKNTGAVTFRINRGSSVLNGAKLLIIDECSMVDDKMGNDLLSFGVPILVLGDPAQLPPVAGTGFFTKGKPDVMLTEIHRQAAENPVIWVASQIRQGIYPDYGTYGDSKIVSKITSTEFMEADQILAGRNITRQDMNRKKRKLLGREIDTPVAGDRLICLENDRDLGIFNGGMFNCIGPVESKYKTNFNHYSVISEDEEDALPQLVKVHSSFFLDVPKPDWKILKGSQSFDHGWAITTHKAQGSGFAKPLIYDESWCFREFWTNWLYTAVTRTIDKFIIMKG